MSAEPVLVHGFQYPSAEHQEQTAIAGMWLFLATEVLLFGGLILSWIYARHFNPLGFAAGARETFVRARLERDGVAPLSNQDSGLQRALAEADVLIRRLPHSAAVAAGSMVSVIDF